MGKGELVGLTFVRIRQTEEQRLARVIADLRIRGSGEAAYEPLVTSETWTPMAKVQATNLTLTD